MAGVAWSNGTGYSDPEMDRIIEAAQIENDPARRRALLVTMQQKAQTDLPSINLLELQHFAVTSARVRGLSTVPDGYAEPLTGVWLSA